MNWALFSTVGLILLSASSGTAAQRVVNITAGSLPGWVPSEAEEATARTVAKAYFEALEAGEFSKVYNMLSPRTKSLWQSETKFARFESDNRTQRGKLQSRDFVKLTWTHGSATAPDRGTYVAIDTRAKHSLAARQCGYIVLHRAEGSQRFTVVRTENVIMLDRDAEQFDTRDGPGSADAEWNKYRANCPGEADNPA